MMISYQELVRTFPSLGDVLDVNSGVGFPIKFQGKKSGDYPVYKVSDISLAVTKNNGNLITAGHFISKKEAIELKGKIFRLGSTAFAKIGEAVKLNRRAIIQSPGLADNNVMVISAVLHEMDKFIFHFMNTIDLSEQARSTTVPSIRKGDIENIQLALPPISEQKIIAEKLDTLLAQVDSAKARLNKIPQTLKRFRQAVLATAVGGILTYEWRINQNITEGQPHPLSKAGTIIAGQSPASSQVNNLGKGVPYVTGPEQWDGSKILHHKWTEYPKKISPDNSIFVTVKGAGVGTTFPGCHCAIGRDVYAFVPNQEMNYKYTLYAIQAAAADVVVKAKGLIPGLTKADILEHYVYIPVIEEQHEIVRRVEQLFAYADTIEKQVNSALTRINSLTQSILAKAFRGELTAQWRAENPDLISGENSAAALLEKIKAERAASGGKKSTRKKA
ncbi:restriction endonuclease subunit S [Klebsiella pasteurii]